MSFKLITTGILIILLSCDINGSPLHDSRDIQNREIVGQATNIITSKLLKGAIESNKNYVFSPIGYATILTILGEGAQEDTKNDITNVLKYPDNRELVRGAYRSVISHMQGMDPQSAPQFRTWFYIYKNNSIDETYKEMLTTDYYVTVKNVEPYNPEVQPEEEATTHEIVKEIEEQPSTKSIDVPVKSDDSPTNSKDIVEFDSFKMESGPVDETRIDFQNDASKFDEVVEDRQYVEVPVIKDAMKKFAKNEGKKTEKNYEKKLETAPSDADSGNNSQLPIKQYADMEIMQAEESRFGKAFGGKTDEGASIISGNSIVGEKEDLDDDDSDRYEPKMLLFNGLYYHGNWATPFQHLRDAGNLFHTSQNQKVPVKMMKACGYFRIGNFSKYDVEAIEFPYDNNRYSMLVLLPRGVDGLKKLISDFNSNTLNEITDALDEELIDVSLPKFEVQTTGGAEKVLAKEGLASLFTSKADFSGISKLQKLRVGELQQHVTLRIDETSSTENFLTATNALRSNAPVNDERSVIVNRPFLFFIRDRIDDVTVIAGKITSLEAFAMDEPEITK